MESTDYAVSVKAIAQQCYTESHVLEPILLRYGKAFLVGTCTSTCIAN